MQKTQPRAASARARVLRSVSVLGVVGLLLTACAAGEQGDSGDAAAPGPQTFTYAIPGEVTSLDTQNTQSVSNKYVDGIRESTLLQYDVADECTADDIAGLQMKPTKLVNSYEVSEDGRTISFVLNEGILSQAGNELTSEDVVYSIDRIADIGTTGKFLFFTAGGFDIENPVTVKSPTEFDLNVANPSSISTQVLSFMWLEILDSATLLDNATADDPWAKKFLDANIANFGPWDLESFEPGVSTVYKRNANAEPSEGNVERIVLRTIADSSTRSQLLQTGEIDRAEALSFTEYTALQELEDVRVSLCSSVSRTFLGLNWEDPAFGDVDVRRAISLALDREALTESIYGEFGVPATFGVHVAAAPTVGSSSYEFRLEEARELLEESGHEGLSFSLSYSPENPTNAESLAVYIKQQLAEIGIEVTLAPVGSVTDYRAALAAGLQAYLYAETPVVPDSGYSWLQQHGGASAQNFSRVDSVELDTRAAAISASTPGTPERAKAVDAFSEQVDKEVPVLYLTDLIVPMANRTCANSAPNSAILTYPMLDDVTLTC